MLLTQQCSPIYPDGSTKTIPSFSPCTITYLDNELYICFTRVNNDLNTSLASHTVNLYGEHFQGNNWTRVILGPPCVFTETWKDKNGRNEPYWFFSMWKFCPAHRADPWTAQAYTAWLHSYTDFPSPYERYVNVLPLPRDFLNHIFFSFA